jgi:preprotein translocase subunit SecG
MPTFLMICFLVVCVLLILSVLLQKGRGGGLGSAFGGGGGSSAFGTRTGDVFTWVTIILTGLFLALAILMALAVNKSVYIAPVAKVTVTPTEWPQEKISQKKIKVFMKCKTKGASIHYTTDDTEPTQKSSRYSKTAIPITDGCVLKVKAFSPGKTDSETVSITYKKPEKKVVDIKPAGPSTTPKVENPTTPKAATPAAPKTPK